METTTCTKISAGLYEMNGYTIESVRSATGSTTARGFNVRQGADMLEWFPTKRDAMAYVVTGTPRHNTSLHMELAGALSGLGIVTQTERSFVMLTGVRDDKEFHIHGAGCRDIKRGVQQGKYWDAGFAQMAVSAEALVEAEVQVFTDQDQGWTANDFKVFPCCK
jgi:hypothetical protein